MNRNSVSLFLFPPTRCSHTVSPGVFSFCVVGRTEKRRERGGDCLGPWCCQEKNSGAVSAKSEGTSLCMNAVAGSGLN